MALGASHHQMDRYIFRSFRDKIISERSLLAENNIPHAGLDVFLAILKLIDVVIGVFTGLIFMTLRRTTYRGNRLGTLYSVLCTYCM